MIKELSNKVIFQDFIEKTSLTDEEIEILKLYLKRKAIISIGIEVNMSDRNVSRIIRNIKDKYNIYKKMEIAKIEIFLAKK